MSKEKYIRGKKDDANHVGRHHNVKAEQAADYHLWAYLNGELEMERLIPQPEEAQKKDTRRDN